MPPSLRTMTFLDLNMKALRTFEIPVIIYESTWRKFPEVLNLQTEVEFYSFSDYGKKKCPPDLSLPLYGL
jgi:hypothetical protein